jgi:hypothetical protein
MQWNIYNTSNFFETSIGISNKLHELEINSYFNFETENYTLILNIVSISKFISQFWKLLFQSKKLIFNYVNYFMNLILLI